MSGSPIVQDGKLVGAVTHVLLDDPQRGYGILAENMLSASGMTAQSAASAMHPQNGENDGPAVKFVLRVQKARTMSYKICAKRQKTT